ncbi:MAG: DNRLRE domain-containing protein [Anaerolineae bacterium]
MADRTHRRHFWLGSLALVGFAAVLAALLGAPMVTQADVAPTPPPADQVVQGPSGGVSALARPFAPFPGIYQFYDSRNVDPRQYPIVGGHTVLDWPFIEPAEGQIVWDRVERWIAAEAALGKPVGIGFSTYNGLCCGGSAVPQWVYDQDPNAKVICNGNWVVPKYWNETFLTKYANFIRALGQRYDGDPRIAWVEIGAGMYGETIPCENELDPCLQAAGLTSDLWVQTVNRITSEFRAAFPNTTLLLQMAPFFLSNHERKAFTDYAASLGVGMKHNGLRPDADALECNDPLSTWYRSLQHDPMIVHGDHVPVAWETYGYMLPGQAGRLWGILNALDKHSDYIVADGYITQEPAGFAYLEFANRYLGRTLQDTPSVWVALRETLPQYTWYPERGNYSFWLYQVDEVPGGKSVPAWQVSSAPEGAYTRRTDQATGNPYLYFDVDDRYLYGGQNVVTVTVTYYDAGTDTWELQYDAVGNDYKSAGVVAKTNTGQWLKKVWVLTDAEFANAQAGGGTHVGSDFRLFCRNDGDDYFHMVDVAKRSTSGAPTLVEVAFRQGESGYAGVQDTYLSSWAPNTNYGVASTFSARTSDVMHGLIRVDLSSIPAGSRVLSAKLSVYALGRSNTNGAWLEAYRVLRPWSEAQATWTYAQTGSPWNTPGCAGIGTDREGQYLDRGPLPSDRVWTEIEVGRAVQAWLDNPSSNYGLLLRLTSNGSVQYDFASSQYEDPTLRPRLRVTYALPAGAPVPTTTPTATPTASAAPTVTPTASAVPPTATPTPTASPTPTATGLPPATLVLQQGVAGYTGTNDTFLSSWNPTRNYAGADYLGVRSLGVMGALVRFDVSQVPADATVVSATLSVYVRYRSNGNWMWLEAYDVYRDWVDAQATWYQARTGVNWGQPGCGDTSTDRAGTPTDRAYMQADKTWYTLDITPLVQRWVQNAATNRGVFLWGNSSGSVEYDISSAEAEDPALRPKLTIAYRTSGSPAPTPTPTQTPTPTATVPAPTATPTCTPTVPAPTATPTRTATTPPSQPQEVVLPAQKDAYISLWYPTSNFGTNSLLGIRPEDVSAALFQFDLAPLPPGAQVLSATLELWAQRQSNIHTLTASAYQVLRPWDEGSVTWYQATASTPWQTAGCNGPSDRSQTPTASQLLDGSSRWYAWDVTPLVQGWVQGQPNHGLILKASGKVSVQYDFASREWPDPAYRPRLVVRYTAGSTPTPTPTRTATSAPGSAIEVTFQQGRNGYTGTRDTDIIQWYPDRNLGTATFVRIRSGDIEAGLLYFDVSSIPSTATIESARLQMYVIQRSNANWTWPATYQMKRAWEEEQATWNLAANGVPWGAPGANDPLTDRWFRPTDLITMTTVNTWYEWDVTEMVQDWVFTPGANKGLTVRVVDHPETPVEYLFASSEYPTENLRPKLVVRYRLGPPPTATPVPTHTPTPTPTPRLQATVTVTFRQGVDGYTGAQDTYISSYAPNTNYHLDHPVQIRTPDLIASLFRFDVSSIPRDAHVIRAILSLYPVSRSNSGPLHAWIYPVLRPWAVDQATWTRPLAGQTWAAAGCNEPGVDRAGDPLDRRYVEFLNVWYEWDVTEAVRQWVRDPAANYGLVLKAYGDVKVMYAFASGEDSVSIRPKLTVTYGIPAR